MKKSPSTSRTRVLASVTRYVTSSGSDLPVLAYGVHRACSGG